MTPSDITQSHYLTRNIVDYTNNHELERTGDKKHLSCLHLGKSNRHFQTKVDDVDHCYSQSFGGVNRQIHISQKNMHGYPGERNHQKRRNNYYNRHQPSVGMTKFSDDIRTVQYVSNENNYENTNNNCKKLSSAQEQKKLLIPKQNNQPVQSFIIPDQPKKHM